MLCGLIMQARLAHCHELGTGLCGDQAAILSTIHLYNAALLSGGIASEYKDLDQIVEW